MNFTTVYMGFIIISTIYRIGRITKSYSYKPEPKKVSASATYPIMLFLYLTVWLGAIFEYFYTTYILEIKEVNLIISLIGLLMYIAVIPLRKWALDNLGKQITSDITIIEGHRLVKEGPYQYMRHPLIFCAIIEVFSLSLIPNSYWTFLIALFAFMPFMLIRAYLEEKALIEEFKDEYLIYKKEVYAFFPLKKVSR